MKMKKDKPILPIEPIRQVEQLYCRTCGAIVMGDRCTSCGTPIEYVKLRGIK